MLEFDLHQGWTRGLRIGFENIETSAAFNPKLALSVEQTHSDDIHVLSDVDFSKASPIATADGILVLGDSFKNCKRPLMVKTADCAPIVIVDRESQALAIIHAGWRGLAKGIHTKLFKQGHFQPKTTWVWVGPCMSGTGFEVREDMWKNFPLSVQRDPRIFAVTKNAETRIFHPWTLIEDDFKALDVNLIYNVEVNTYADASYHSYRRSSHEGTKLAGHNYSWCKFF
ncbi:MAG: polyphenol oxidase family protein [Bdellovibrionota bacterium]